MIFFHGLPHDISYKIFYALHPIHVFLSAIVTTSMYKIYQCQKGNDGCGCAFWQIFIVGYIGSVGIATLSDSLIPYLGERLLHLPHAKAHIGFIEAWWIVNPLAILGVTIAYFKPQTKFPHAGHVLLSTWASLFHILMALDQQLSIQLSLIIFSFLFISVWLPCCLSDIIFPLLITKKPSEC